MSKQESNEEAIFILTKLRLEIQTYGKFDIAEAPDKHSFAWHGSFILISAVEYLRGIEMDYRIYHPLYTREDINTAEPETRQNKPTLYNKPPVGVLPQHLWREQRNIELARAIYERLDFEFSNLRSIKSYLVENLVNELLSNLQQINQNDVSQQITID